MMDDYDIIIVGAGFVGLTLAYALAQQGKRIALIEAKALNEKKQQQAIDGRAIALSLKSQRILKDLNIWPQLEASANPLTQVQVSQQHRFGKLYLSAQEQNTDVLGYVIPAPQLGSALLSLCEQQNNITWFCPDKLVKVTQEATHISAHLENQKTLNTQLMIIAEGTQSDTRTQFTFSSVTKDYQQYAIVTNLNLSAGKQHAAFQRFTTNATLALLPLKDQRYTLVVTVSEENYPAMQALTDEAFIDKIQHWLGFQLGTISELGPRQSYPLKALFVEKAYEGRLLLMGNAAHTLSPIAAQGLNLTLRDIICLRHLLESSDSIATILARYQQERLPDQKNMLRFTDGLVNLSSSTIGKSVLSLGFGALNYLPFAKRRLFAHLLGY